MDPGSISLILQRQRNKLIVVVVKMTDMALLTFSYQCALHIMNTSTASEEIIYRLPHTIHYNSSTLNLVNMVQFCNSPFPRGLATFEASLNRVSLASPETCTNAGFQ